MCIRLRVIGCPPPTRNCPRYNTPVCTFGFPRNQITRRFIAIGPTPTRCQRGGVRCGVARRVSRGYPFCLISEESCKSFPTRRRLPLATANALLKLDLLGHLKFRFLSSRKRRARGAAESAASETCSYVSTEFKTARHRHAYQLGPQRLSPSTGRGVADIA